MHDVRYLSVTMHNESLCGFSLLYLSVTMHGMGAACALFICHHARYLSVTMHDARISLRLGELTRSISHFVVSRLGVGG